MASAHAALPSDRDFSRSPRITMAFSREHRFPAVVPDAHRFRPCGWWEPLQRLCWWFLGRTGALRRHVVEQTYFTTVHIDGVKALDAIFKARGELFKQRRRPPGRVLIGAEDMAEIMGQPEFREMQIAGQGASFEGRLGYGQRIFGIPVEVVPHMRGALVL